MKNPLEEHEKRKTRTFVLPEQNYAPYTPNVSDEEVAKIEAAKLIANQIDVDSVLLILEKHYVVRAIWMKGIKGEEKEYKLGDDLTISEQELIGGLMDKTIKLVSSEEKKS